MWVFQKHAGGDTERMQLFFGPRNKTGMLGCYSAECTRLSVL